MRRNRLAVVVACGVFVLVGASVAGAHDMSSAKVPFPFIVNGRTFPAGEYRVVENMQDPALIQIVSEDGRQGVLVMVRVSDSVSERGDCTLEFRQVGNDRFLTRISVPGDTVLEVPLPESLLAAERAQAAAR